MDRLSFGERIAGRTKPKQAKPKPFTPFGGDPKSERPTKKETRDEIDAIRHSGIPDSGHDNWMNNPKVARRTTDSI